MNKYLVVASMLFATQVAAQPMLPEQNLSHVMTCYEPEKLQEVLLKKYGERPVIVAAGAVRVTPEIIITEDVVTTLYINMKDRTFTVTVSDGNLECVQSTGTDFKSYTEIFGQGA